ncbi:WD40 repeat domain-containing protein [Actinoplanes sp. DH11]|uniref:WD40 repeat domain-containing protein n=1 Tax=Actinoplanes sp. DH11 TaxID=2857011 RepID=UPI001E4B5066|nr:WD40 repeat domain-containing protein [Actinoplanes sp. DH11]
MSAPDDVWFAGEVLSGLLDSITPAPGAGRRWDAAEPYLLRRAIEHARDAGRIDELLLDPEFLVHADPATLIPALGDAGSPEARRLAAIYRASARFHRVADPMARRQLLGLDSLRYGLTDVATRLANPQRIAMSPLQPVWSSAAQADPALLTTVQLDGWIYALAVAGAEDRPLIVAAGADRAVRCFDLATGEQFGLPLTGHTDVVRAAAAGTLRGRAVVATAGDDGTLRIWDVAAGQPVAVLTGSDRALNAVALTGDVAVAAGEDHVIRAWNLLDGELLWTVAWHTKSVQALLSTVFEGRGAVVSAGRDGRVGVWSVGDGRPWGELEHDDDRWIQALAATDDIIILGGTVEIGGWAARRGTFGLAATSAGAVAVTTVDGRRLIASTAHDGGVRLWPLIEPEFRPGAGPAPEPVLLRGHTGPVSAIAVAGSVERPLLVTAGGDATIRVWDVSAAVGTQPGGERQSVHLADVNAVAVADGTVVSGADDGNVLVWDAETGASGLVESGPDAVFAVRAGLRPAPWTAVATDTGLLRLSTGADALWEAEPGPVNALADDGELVAAGGDDGVLRVWRIESGAVVAELDGHTDAINAVDLARVDHQPFAASGADDGTVRLWSLWDAAQRGPALGDGTDPMNAVRLIGVDEQLLVAAAGDDTRIRIWDAADGELVHTLTAHDQPVLALARCSAGSIPLLVSGGADAVLRVWNPATGVLLAAHHMPEAVRTLEAAGEGRVAVGYGWEVAVFDLSRCADRAVPAPPPAYHLEIDYLRTRLDQATAASEITAFAVKLADHLRDHDRDEAARQVLDGTIARLDITDPEHQRAIGDLHAAAGRPDQATAWFAQAAGAGVPEAFDACLDVWWNRKLPLPAITAREVLRQLPSPQRDLVAATTFIGLELPLAATRLGMSATAAADEEMDGLQTLNTNIGGYVYSGRFDPNFEDPSNMPGEVIGGTLTDDERAMIQLMDAKDRARYLLQKRIQEKAEMAELLSQLQTIRHQTAMSVINNIR